MKDRRERRVRGKKRRISNPSTPYRAVTMSHVRPEYPTVSTNANDTTRAEKSFASPRHRRRNFDNILPLSVNIFHGRQGKMSHLPVGWTVSNKDGAQAGPARRLSADPEDDNSGPEGEGQGEQGLDIAPDSPGWEDMEADEDEDLAIKCLICTQTFPQARPVLNHCLAEHNFDFLGIVKEYQLDFYSTIKLVNYIRHEGRLNQSYDLSSPELWKDDKYLQPALENDALLFSLDELIGDAAEEKNGKVADYDEVEAARQAMEKKTELEDVPE